jgi:Intracellular proteinase inhibitor
MSKSDLQAIAVKPPPNDSPFFIERQEAREAAAQAGREGYGMYVHKPPKPPAQQQIKKFFQGFFGHGKKRGETAGTAPMTLTVDPSEFSLAQTSELDVSLKISNVRKHEIELSYPDNQRLEILIKDPSGNVVSRWSEDRAFDQQEGFTEINPDEFVIYAERISTAKMKAGQTYTIEASLANQEGYTTSVPVTPRP